MVLSSVHWDQEQPAALPCLYAHPPTEARAAGGFGDGWREWWDGMVSSLLGFVKAVVAIALFFGVLVGASLWQPMINLLYNLVRPVAAVLQGWTHSGRPRARSGTDTPPSRGRRMPCRCAFSPRLCSVAAHPPGSLPRASFQPARRGAAPLQVRGLLRLDGSPRARMRADQSAPKVDLGNKAALGASCGEPEPGAHGRTPHPRATGLVLRGARHVGVKECGRGRRAMWRAGETPPGKGLEGLGSYGTVGWGHGASCPATVRPACTRHTHPAGKVEESVISKYGAEAWDEEDSDEEDD